MERISNKKIFDCYFRVMGQRVDAQDKQDVIAFAEAVLRADRYRQRMQHKQNIERAERSGRQMGESMAKALKVPCKRCGLVDGCSVGCGDE